MIFVLRTDLRIRTAYRKSKIIGGSDPVARVSDLRRSLQTGANKSCRPDGNRPACSLRFTTQVAVQHRLYRPNGLGWMYRPSALC